MRYLIDPALGPPSYIAALGLSGDLITDRFAALADLRAAYNVTVHTGPRAAPFWSLAAPTVRVRVVPDGYDMAERVETETVWALWAAGANLADARRLAGKPVTRGKFRAVQEAATRLLADLCSASGVRSGGQTVHPFEETVAELSRLLDSPDLLALDWEWDERTHDPLGLAWADATRAGFVHLPGADPVQRPLVDAVRDAVAARLARGLPTVLHHGRADLGTQHPGDPAAGPMRGLHDTGVAAYLLGEPVLDLKTLAMRRLGRDLVKYPGDLTRLPPEIVAAYAANDARATYDLWLNMFPALVETGQLRVYTEFEQPLVPIITSMERYGFPLDPTAVRRLHDEYAEEEERLRCAICVGYGYDPAQDAATRRLLTAELGYDPGTLDQRTLSKIPDGLIDLLLLYRRTRTLRRNFLAPRLEADHVYPRFNQAGTVGEDRRAPRSGRLSSSDPNLQNQPTAIREIYTAPPGHVVFAADYSQLELRIAASVSGDREMIRVFTTPGGDLHETTRLAIERETGGEADRGLAKIVNFGVNYGGDDPALERGLTKARIFTTLAQRRGMLAAHRRQFADFHAWARREGQAARERGYAETMWGRRYVEPTLQQGDVRARQHAERFAVNLKIQGTAADICKLAMIRAVDEALRPRGGHLSVQVHDELVGCLPEDEAVEGLAALVAAAESIEIPHVRLRVEAGLGRNWKEAKASARLLDAS